MFSVQVFSSWAILTTKGLLDTLFSITENGCKVKIPVHVVKKSEHGKADKT